MSFARSKRGSIFDDEIKNKENLPGPSAYNPRNSCHINGFKYVDITASTITGSILERSQDDIDITYTHPNTSSTPVKRKRPGIHSQNSSRLPGPPSFLNRPKKQTRDNINNLQIMNELKAENNQLKARVQKISDLKDELEQQYISANEHKNQSVAIEDRLKQKIEEKDRTIFELNGECQRNEEKMRELRDKEEQSHKENIEHQSKNLDLMKRCESEQAKITKLKALIEQKSAQLEKFQLEQFSNSEATKAFEVKLKTLRAKFDEERSRLVAEIRDQKAEMEELSSALNQRTIETENMVEERQEKYELTQKYMDTAKQMEAEKIILLEERDQFDTENKDLTFKVDELKSVQSDLSEQIQSLQLANDTLADAHAKTVMDLESASQQASVQNRDKIQELTNRLASMTTNYESRSVETASQTISMQAEIDALKQRLGEKDIELENIRSTSDDLQEKLNHSKQQHQIASNELVGQKEMTEAIKQQLALAEQNAVEKRSELIKTMEEKDQLYIDSETQRAQKEQEIVRLSSENQNLTENITSLESSLETVQAQLSESDLSKKALLDVNEKLSTDIAAKALEVVDAQKNFARCVQDNKKLKSEKELLRKCGLDYKLKRDKMQESLDKITADVADERKQYQQNDQSIVRLKAELEESQRLYTAATTKIRNVTDDLRIMREESNKNKILKDEHDQRLLEIDGLERQLSNARSAANDWKEKYEDLETFISPFRQDLAKYEEGNRHLTDANRQKKKELDDLHKKLAGQMGHQNQRQKIHYLTKVKSENAELREKFEMSQLDLKKARRQIESLQDDLNATRGVRRFDPKKAFQH